MRKRIFQHVTALAVILSIMLLFTVPGKAESVASENNLEYLGNIMKMIERKYNGEIPEENLLEGALKGMFNQMDPYTTYFTVDEANGFLGNMEGAYEGVGITIEKTKEFILISKVHILSPAEKAGLRNRDVIVSIDGESTKNLSIEQASSLIKGISGSKVVLGIKREEKSEIQLIEVERKQIKISPLTLDIRGDIGYIKLEIFNANTEEYITKALEELDEKNITKVILDLRDNPGGQVDQAAALAGKFVPEGLITKLSFKDNSVIREEYHSSLKETKYNLVLLVNGLSASASEIVAGAVQDREAGTVIGVKTYGKAKVQSMIPLLTPQASQKYKNKFGKQFVDGFELSMEYGIEPEEKEILGWAKITTGVYLTPNGRLIQGEGINPDIIVDDIILQEDQDDIDIRNVQKLSITWKPDLEDEGIDIYNAEKILKLIGYDVDVPDIILDQKTFQAINDFRVENGLYSGGVLDFTTQKALNRELEKKVLEIDKQYSKAVEILNKVQ